MADPYAIAPPYPAQNFTCDDVQEGLKQSLKIDTVANEVANKFNTAKDFVQQQQHNITDSRPVRSVKEKIGHLVPQNLNFGNYFHPGTWSKYFPSGGGDKQSPIDIVISQSTFDEALGDCQFLFKYAPEDCVDVCNVGATWRINVTQKTGSTLNAVHLPGTYRLIQVHAHWGTEPMNGSEHVVGGVGYAGELHIMHLNNKYETEEVARQHPDGVATLAVFLNETLDDNPAFEPLVQLLTKVPYRNDSMKFSPRGFDIKSLLPDKKEFWTYEGSLTSPPFDECVIWTIFRAAVSISNRQLDVFRSLYAVPVEDIERNAQRVTSNIRAVQPLKNRVVRASFRAGGISAR